MVFALIAGGAAGNLYDRIFRGLVIDWIDLHWVGWHWPAFNLADCAIVDGVMVMVAAQVSSPLKQDNALRCTEQLAHVLQNWEPPKNSKKTAPN